MGRWPAAASIAALTMLTLGASRAAAATTPSLLAVPFTTAPGAVADTELDLTLADQGAPPAKIVLYVPKGYSVNLSQAVGTKIADVFAKVSAGGSQQSPTGQIVVDEPSKYATDAPALRPADLEQQLHRGPDRLDAVRRPDDGTGLRPDHSRQEALGAARRGVSG